MSLITNTAATLLARFGDRSGFRIARLRAALQDFAAGFEALASVDTGEGASQVGVEDAGAYLTGDDVEECLAELGSVRLYRRFVTIPMASVRTLFTTPYSIIPAPGAGKFIAVQRAHWWLDYGTAGYDAAAVGDTLGLKYTNAAGAQLVDTVAGNAIGSAVADYHTLVRGVVEVIPVANAAVVASIDAGEWFSAAGDSPLKIEVIYAVMTHEPTA